MAELNLLPRKVFEITLESGTVIRGQFSFWSVKRFCDKKKIPLSKLDEMLTVDNIAIDDICQLILCAVEYTSRKEKHGFAFTDVDACDWIEELGGLMSENYKNLMAHAGGEADDGEKKSPLNLETSSELQAGLA